MIKKTSEIRAIGTKKILLLYIVSLFAVCMPFSHMFLSKETPKEIIKLDKMYDAQEISETEYESERAKHTIFGYSKPRSFVYALGNPVCMLYFGVLILFFSKYLKNEIKQLAVLSSLMLTFISLYFIVWVFWIPTDMPQHIYYIAMGLIAIACTVLVYLVSKIKFSHIQQIKDLIYYIVVTGKKHVPAENRKNYALDYQKEISKIMDKQ